MKTKSDTKVSQTITLEIKGQKIELTKEEALEIAAKLDEVTGRKLPVPAPIVIEKPVYRDRLRPCYPWPDMQPMWRDSTGDPPLDLTPRITCENNGLSGFGSIHLARMQAALHG